MSEKYTSMQDEALLLLAAKGDRDAEEQLAVRYSWLVRMCARPFFLAGGDSEDLTQEGMFGLLRAIREYDPSTKVPFHSFAETCIRNRLLSAIKTATRLKHMPLNSGVSLEEILNEETNPALPQEKAFRRDPEEMVLARESTDELFHTIDRYLSKYEREILRLYLEGRSYREIAQTFGRSEKSVDNAVQRIRKKIAKVKSSGVK